MLESAPANQPSNGAERVLIGHSDPDVLDAIASCARRLGLTALPARHHREVRQLFPIESLSTTESSGASHGEDAEEISAGEDALARLLVMDERWLYRERHGWARSVLDRSAELGYCVLAIAPAVTDGATSEAVTGVDDRLTMPLDEDRICSALGWAMRLSAARTELRITQRELIRRDGAIAMLSRRLERMAERDTLTGLPNRQATMDHLRMLWERMAHPSDGLSVILCDIDDFQQLNARHGQEAGDAALRQVGAALRSRVRADDYVGRIGNEEFLVVLHRIGLDGAYRRAEELRAGIATKPVRYHDGQKTMQVTASFGVAMRSEGDVDVDHLLMRAMSALENAKAAGQDCVELLDAPRLAA